MLHLDATHHGLLFATASLGLLLVACEPAGSDGEPPGRAGGPAATFQTAEGVGLAPAPDTPTLEDAGVGSSDAGPDVTHVSPPSSDGPCADPVARQMIDAVNASRAREGVPPLTCDPQLVQVARAHSADMCARGFFGHVNPDGDGTVARTGAAGLSFGWIAENLLRATSSVADTHRAMMTNPDRRRNVLFEGFEHVGVGVASCGGDHLWTEVFIGDRVCGD